MITANFKAYANYVTDSLYQWDLNQTLSVSGLNLAVAPEVHFSNAHMDKAIVRQATIKNHVVMVDIPNSVLQDPLTINAHIGIYEGKTFKVVELVQIPVIPRERPIDYQIEVDDKEVYSFRALENALADKATNARVDNLIAHNNDTNGNSELIDMRTDMAGKIYGSAGEAMRYGSNRVQPTVCFSGGHFNYDTKTRLLSYVVDNTSYQMTSVFNGRGTDNLPFNPTETDFNIAASPGTLQYIILNTIAGTLRNVSYKDYAPNTGDYILFAYIQYKIYPIAVSPYDLYEDGIPAYRNNQAKGVLHTIKDDVVVDMVKGTVTIPATNYYKYNRSNGFIILAALSEPQTVSVTISSGVLTFVCYNTETRTLSVVDRQHTFSPDEYCLFGVCSGDVVPIEMNPACVTYKTGIDNTSMITIDKMVSQIFHNDAPVKVVLGGDSITHGVGGTGFAQDGDVVLETPSRTWNRNTNGYCWAKLFKQYVESNYNATVVNNGCTGSDSTVWNSNKETLIPSDTDLVILTVGTNDRNARTGVATKTEALNIYYNNISSIVKYCHANNIHIILASPIPSTDANEAENRLCHIYELNGILQKVASENNIEYANLYNEIYYYMMDNNLNIANYLDDGLHPNDAMYKIMFYRYLKLLNLAPSYVVVE